MTEPRPAFYALRPGPLRDLITLLHLPYTIMHLSFVVLGAALAPVLHADRLIATLAAFFLAVGVAAHFLDELNGRPLRTQIPAHVLLGGALLALLAACAIGVAGLLWVSPLLVVFVVMGAFIVLAYNLELAGGRFHGDVTFALFWGAFPFLTAYWVMGESLTWPALPGAASCFAVARLQRILSTEARTWRRRIATVEGEATFQDGGKQRLTRETLLASPEGGLRALCAAVPLAALAALWARLQGR